MDEHGRASADVAQKHDCSEVTKYILCRGAESRADLSLCVVVLLLSSNRQRLAVGALQMRPAQVAVLLRVVDAVPGSAEDESQKKHQTVYVLRFSEDIVNNWNGTLRVARGGSFVQGRHGGLYSGQLLHPKDERFHIVLKRTLQLFLER